MNEQDDTRLDDFLRDKLGAYRPPPTAAAWNGIEARLRKVAPPSAPRRGWGRSVLPALLAGMIGVLVGWLLPHGAAVPRPERVTAMRGLTTTTTNASPHVVAGTPVDASAAPADVTGGRSESASPVVSLVATPVLPRPVERHKAAIVAHSRSRYASVGRQTRATNSAETSSSSPLASVAGVAINPAVPTVLLPLAAAETAVQVASADSTTAARNQRRLALITEKRELARLQRRADSLLYMLALGAEASVLSAAPLTAEDETPPAARAVVVRREPRLTHRWQVALTGAAERAFLTSTAPTADSLATLRRHHEAGRPGLSAALLAEYRFNERLSVAAGAGYARLNTELRLTEQQTTVAVQYTTTTTVNGNQTSVVTTPIIAQRTTESYRVLQPSYHFLTVPLVVRYRLTPASRRTRCWADVAVGAQALLFRGGTQPESLDGRTFQETRVGAGGGLFRPATLAFTGALAVNYALAPRLAASVAPAVRWQPQSVYRRGAGLQQRLTSTGLQLGLHWTL